jgi:hypothetical protein
MRKKRPVIVKPQSVVDLYKVSANPANATLNTVDTAAIGG